MTKVCGKRYVVKSAEGFVLHSGLFALRTHITIHVGFPKLEFRADERPTRILRALAAAGTRN